MAGLNAIRNSPNWRGDGKSKGLARRGRSCRAIREDLGLRELYWWIPNSLNRVKSTLWIGVRGMASY